jgi:hypothetical protein
LSGIAAGLLPELKAFTSAGEETLVGLLEILDGFVMPIENRPV